MKNYINTGVIVSIPAPTDVKSGDLVTQGALFGFAQADAAEGELVAIVTDGAFEADVAATAPVSIGDVVYLDVINGDLTADASGGDNIRAGIVLTAGDPVDGVATVAVKLSA